VQPIARSTPTRLATSSPQTSTNGSAVTSAKVFVQHLDLVLANWYGNPRSCVFSETCRSAGPPMQSLLLSVTHQPGNSFLLMVDIGIATHVDHHSFNVTAAELEGCRIVG